MDILINMDLFNTCHECPDCKIPKHIKNHPSIISLTDIQLSNLEIILTVPMFKDILSDRSITHNHIDLLTKINDNITAVTNNDIMDHNNHIDIEKRSKELSDIRTNTINEKLKSISEENNELKNKFTEKNIENENNINNVSILKIKCDNIQNELNTVNQTNEIKIKDSEARMQKRNDMLENKLDKKDNEMNMIRENKDTEIKRLNDKKENEMNMIRENKDTEIKRLNDDLFKSSSILNNSQKKGVTGENMTENMYVPDGWDLKTKSKKNYSGDHEFINPISKNIICVDSKYYDNTVPSEEVTKLINDTITTDSNGGIIISHKSRISWDGKPTNSIELQYLSSKSILFISNANELPPQLIKALISLFDQSITLTKGDGNCNNIIKLKKKVITCIKRKNNNIILIQKLKQNLKKKKGQFDFWHNKDQKIIERLEQGISEIITNIQKETYLDDNQLQLNNILSKPNTDGHSVAEIAILKDSYISKVNIIDNNIIEKNTGNRDDIISRLSEISSGSDESNLAFTTEDNYDKDDDETGNNDDVIAEAGNNNDGTENKDNNESYDISIKDFIKEKINIDDPPTKQRNTIKNIREYFLEYCKKKKIKPMYVKFLQDNLEEKDLKKIISDLGYEESSSPGKSYLGKNKQYPKTLSYNITLPYPY